MTPEQLKKARDKLGMTGEEFAEKLDVSRRFVTYRENGARPIDQQFARAVRDLLKYPNKPA